MPRNTGERIDSWFLREIQNYQKQLQLAPDRLPILMPDYMTPAEKAAVQLLFERVQDPDPRRVHTMIRMIAIGIEFGASQSKPEEYLIEPTP